MSESTTYANVRTKTIQKALPGLSPSSTVRIPENCQWSGFQIGTGWLKIGSVVPNATATTAYVGTRKSRISQTTPGEANDGQNQRLVTGAPPVERLSPGLEGRPCVLVERLSLRRQGIDGHALVEVGLAHDRRGEILGDVTLRDELVRIDRGERRDVAVPREVVDAVLVVEHEVEKRVREHRMLRRPKDRDHVVLRLGVVVRPPVAEHRCGDSLRQIVRRAGDVAGPRLRDVGLAGRDVGVVVHVHLDVGDRGELREVLLCPVDLLRILGVDVVELAAE